MLTALGERPPTIPPREGGEDLNELSFNKRKLTEGDGGRRKLLFDGDSQLPERLATVGPYASTIPLGGRKGCSHGSYIPIF